jgi:hypothetical protein
MPIKIEKGSRSYLKKIELSTNRIKQAGAVALARGLIVIWNNKKSFC